MNMVAYTKVGLYKGRFIFRVGLYWLGRGGRLVVCGLQYF